MASNSIILRDSSHLKRPILPKWPVADIGGKSQRGIMSGAGRAASVAPVHVVQSPVYSPGMTLYSSGPAMKDDQAKRERQPGSPVKDSRQDRLKLALRENLKRRKSQARGRSDAVGASSEDADAPLDDGSGKEPGG
jgi:hypothetical protein